jgi:hypothetical protein
VIPLMVTSILCEALMVWLNIGVKVATLPVIALGVGIGVDYALYVMSILLGHLRQGASLSSLLPGAGVDRQGGDADGHYPGHWRGHLDLFTDQISG